VKEREEAQKKKRNKKRFKDPGCRGEKKMELLEGGEGERGERKTERIHLNYTARRGRI